MAMRYRVRAALDPVDLFVETEGLRSGRPDVRQSTAGAVACPLYSRS